MIDSQEGAVISLSDLSGRSDLEGHPGITVYKFARTGLNSKCISAPKIRVKSRIHFVKTRPRQNPNGSTNRLRACAPHCAKRKSRHRREAFASDDRSNSSRRCFRANPPP